MVNLNKKMVVTDLDGTLLDKQHKVSVDDLVTLQMLHKQDITRVIATGRSLFSANMVLNDDLPIDFLIFSSGAGIMDWKSKQIINTNHFSVSEVKQLVSEFLTYDLDFMIHDPIPNNHHFYYYHSGNHADTDFMDRVKLYKPFCSPYADDMVFDNGATQLIAILPDNVSLFEKISSDIKDFKVIRTTSPLDGKSIWMEIFPSHVSKAEGIRWLCNKMEINPESILVLGNDYNDLDMLSITNHSFVVENAPEEIKSRFKVVKSNENSGFSEAVMRWLNFE